jgi:hypothetical protein
MSDDTFSDDPFLQYSQEGHCDQCGNFNTLYAPDIGLPLYCNDCLEKAGKKAALGCLIMQVVMGLSFGVLVYLMYFR